MMRVSFFFNRTKSLNCPLAQQQNKSLKIYFGLFLGYALIQSHSGGGFCRFSLSQIRKLCKYSHKNYESKYNFIDSSRTKTTKKETDKGEILFLESNPFCQTALGLNSVFMYSEICESASLVSRLCLSWFFF